MKVHIICCRPIDNVVQIRLEDFGLFGELYFTRDPSIISKATGSGILYSKLQVVDVYPEKYGAKDCALRVSTDDKSNEGMESVNNYGLCSFEKKLLYSVINISSDTVVI